MQKPLDIGDIETLRELMDPSSGENYMLVFSRGDCGHCRDFAPTLKQLAADIHRTNRKLHSVPIVVAKIEADTRVPTLARVAAATRDEEDEEGVALPELAKQRTDDLRAAIDREFPEIFGGGARGYPLIWLRRGADGATFIVPAHVARTEKNLAAVLADFFDDPSLIPSENTLADRLVSTRPRIVFSYLRGRRPIVPRFLTEASAPMMDVSDGNQMLSALMLAHPELHDAVLGLPADDMDRPDLKAPALTELGPDGSVKEHAYRDAPKFMLDLIRAADAQSPAHAVLVPPMATLVRRPASLLAGPEELPAMLDTILAPPAAQNT